MEEKQLAYLINLNLNGEHVSIEAYFGYDVLSLKEIPVYFHQFYIKNEKPHVIVESPLNGNVAYTGCDYFRFVTFKDDWNKDMELLLHKISRQSSTDEYE